MTLGVYSNSYIPKETHNIKNNSELSNNSDESSKHAFLEDYLQQDSKNNIGENNSKEDENDDLLQTYTPSITKINDYMDNFLLLNAEQVACSNMTQHLIRSDELKETLGFLNIQAAKKMFNNKKSKKIEESTASKFKTGFLLTTPKLSVSEPNNEKNNFFLNHTAG